MGTDPAEQGEHGCQGKAQRQFLREQTVVGVENAAEQCGEVERADRAALTRFVARAVGRDGGYGFHGGAVARFHRLRKWLFGAADREFCARTCGLCGACVVGAIGTRCGGGARPVARSVLRKGKTADPEREGQARREQSRRRKHHAGIARRPDHTADRSRQTARQSRCRRQGRDAKERLSEPGHAARQHDRRQKPRDRPDNALSRYRFSDYRHVHSMPPIFRNPRRTGGRYEGNGRF